MSGFDFTQVDLGGASVQKASETLKPGRYICRTSDVELKKTNGGSWQLIVKLVDELKQGSVIDRITMSHPQASSNPKAQMAVDIGRDRLKTLLTYGGHPTPDKPGDVRKLNGLRVGVIVEQSEDWVDDQGVTRKGGGKPKRNGAYFKPDVPAPAAAEEENPFGGTAQPDFSDQIPF